VIDAGLGSRSGAVSAV